MADLTKQQLCFAFGIGLFAIGGERAFAAPSVEPKPAPPLVVLNQRAQAVHSDLTPDGLARRAAFSASLRGKAVNGWEGWVAQVRCQGALCDVAFYGEDPYAPLEIMPPTPTLDALLGPGVGLERFPYLTAVGVPLSTAKSLRLGQRLRISATLVEVAYSSGLDVTLGAAQLVPVTPPPAAPRGEEGPAQVTEDMQIVLHRGPCYGTCPIYDLIIDGDGTMTFRGERFVAPAGIGEHKTQLTTAQLKSLVEAFSFAGFFNLQDRYQRPSITDQPSVTLTFRRGKATKTIHHSFGDLTAPVKLLLLEDQIDELAGTRRWLLPR